MRLKERKEITLSSSSTSGRSKRRVVLIRHPSCEDEYEGPPKYCKHKLVAPRWTVWTDRNAGRRFYSCPNYNQDGGCGFFAWHDDDFGERANIVIKQLLDDIDNLYDENKRIRGGDDGVGFFQELDSINAKLRKMKHRYQIRESEVRKMERKFKIAKLHSLRLSFRVPDMNTLVEPYLPSFPFHSSNY